MNIDHLNDMTHPAKKIYHEFVKDVFIFVF
jgi:hypothetical protein